MAQPTMRADNLVPRYSAIAPYEVARPLGISRTTSYTDSKKESFLFSFAGMAVARFGAEGFDMRFMRLPDLLYKLKCIRRQNQDKSDAPINQLQARAAIV